MKHTRISDEADQALTKYCKENGLKKQAGINFAVIEGVKALNDLKKKNKRESA